ncbi:MAG TPA: hypothetical protein DEH78_26775 [Solibacterales bacterium]|nr:hypothetical protein [Bryobacterales bacterium]
MRLFASGLLISFLGSTWVSAQPAEEPRSARAALQRAVQASPESAEALAAYAQFLDRHRDSEARGVYEKLLSVVERDGNKQAAAQTARRLALLDLIAGDRGAAERRLATYRSLGGSDLSLPSASASPVEVAHADIPGPIRSFARMAALSPDLPPQDLLPALARNIVTSGYQAAASSESLDQTEYLKLVFRYLSQARELEKLAGAGKEIKIETCESTQTADLLRVLGFRMRGGCGSEVVLETVNATRAFLTMDSGFPLAELEQALRTNRPFVYDFRPTKVPVLYGPEYWLSGMKDAKTGEFIDLFMGDPSLCRLYLGVSKLDPETAKDLRQHMPAPRIRAFAHVLDFFGGMFRLRGGKAFVPGGQRAAAAWGDLAGASPDQGTVFYERLLVRDDGWLAGYYDALARIEGPSLDYLTEPARLKRFYAALRGKVTSPGPARPVFRSNTDLMLLTARLRVEKDGRAHVPGGVEVWKNLFVNHPHGKYDGKLTKAATGWKDADDVLEALFALCRKAVENEPLKIFMGVSDINRQRARPLEPATIDRMAREYRKYGSQYTIFSEAPNLSDKTILQYLEIVKSLDDIGNNALKADTAGTMQALTGLWQIFTRQGVIPGDGADAALSQLIGGFAKIDDTRQLFDVARAGVNVLLKAANSRADASPQDRMIDLLAGVSAPSDVDTHNALVADMIRIFEAQRLVSLKTIFDLDDHLESLSRGEKLNSALLNRLATRIAEIQLPRSSLSSMEKNSFAFGFWTEKHVEEQRKMNLRAVIEKAGQDAVKLKDARGLLAPILRDTLVGFNYIHYAPPGAQVLFTNPLFVRSHDFIGSQGAHQTWRPTEVFGTGWPSSAGGRLVGSLAQLPYALAEAEQNFLIPSREQALIWGDLVPQMLLSAKVPRWWRVTPAQTRWVSLHMRIAEAKLAEAAVNPSLREPVFAALDRRASPARVRRVAELIERGEVREAIDNVMPSEFFLMGLELAQAGSAADPFLSEARQLASSAARDVTPEAISAAFGTPKPTLANTYQPQLLNMRTFPTLMGYSSRIMAESWESNLLYFAALSYDCHMAPSQLNLSVPEWTQKTMEQIFATHLEDWPALLRSLRAVGEEVRAQNKRLMALEMKASAQ